MKVKVLISFCVLFIIGMTNKVTAQVKIEKDTINVIDESDEMEVDVDSTAESEEFVESDEYDKIVNEPGDRYWDFLRPRDFYFDTTYAPAREFYSVWDTIVINPYHVDLKVMEDTLNIILHGLDDCAFHPPAIGDISSDFGLRKWGRRMKFHYGTDLRMEVGDPVYAVFEGIVRVAKRSSDYGYMVLIRHNNGLETLYAHFSQLLVYPGQSVKGGDIIGLAGSTGRSTGPHLHFELRFKGEKINPNRMIHFPSGSLLSDTLQIDKTCFSHLYQVQSAKLKAKYPKYITVKKGQTLSSIARNYGVNIRRLAKLNRISTKAKLRTGQRIRLR